MKKIITTCLVAVMIISLFAVCANAMKKPDIIGYDTYRVRSGDTLWDIAKQSNGWNNLDAHEIIDDMEDESNCTATIYPGQVVYIPIYDFN